MASHIRYDQGEATRLKLLCIGRVKVRQIGQKILLFCPRPPNRWIGQKPCFFCGPCLPDHIPLRVNRDWAGQAASPSMSAMPLIAKCAWCHGAWQG